MNRKNKNNIHMEDRKGKPVNSMALDDEKRIKILSPGLLVFKRFIRNKLAITGAIFILTMFIFSYFGGWLMPYREDEVFTKYVDMSKVYAAVSENTEYKFITTDNIEFPMIARSQFVLATNNDRNFFESQGVSYSIEKLADELFVVFKTREVAVISIILGDANVALSDPTMSTAFAERLAEAVEGKEENITYNDRKYLIIQGKKNFLAYELEPLALATLNRYDFISADFSVSYDFAYAMEIAMHELMETGVPIKTVTLEGADYEMEVEEEKASIYLLNNGDRTLYANISRFLVESIYQDVFISINFKDQVKAMMAEGVEGIQDFVYVNINGEEEEYTIERNNTEWVIRWIEDTLVIKAYDPPSKEHIMGTDGNGMDILTRLMYGGRISLMIGFIVVVIETIIGVILGGIAGYFGKWVDNLIMRVVDTFNSIPSLPIIIIIGAMMDAQRVDPKLRMIYLMFILAFLGWPGIARLVRGQILSLREQEFMIATEATGLSVSKRIFKHLVPNVIPQLIVISTLSLGGVILTESVLSFLGLGVKFPFASWGNIINAVSNVHVMTNYLFVWIPAGFCILITVLGFNFIGDGLRDAFDPKMKR
ncbi:MAG: ABC transporter permease [Clostridia bacterium]